MHSNTSTPRSLSPIQEGPVNNMEQIALYPHVNHSRNESIETSQFSSESDSDDNNNNNKKLKRVKMKRGKLRPSIDVIESSAPVFQTGDFPLSNIRNNGTYTANSSTSTLNYNTDIPPSKKSYFPKLLRNNDKETVLPITTVTNEKETKKKKQRNCCLNILLIIIILFLLGNVIALDVIYFRSPVLQAQNITTLINNTKDATNAPPQEQNIKATICMTLLGTTAPKEFSCGNCLDEQSFYNVSTFCTLKSIWANSINQTSIETNLGWMQDSNFCEWGGIKCDDNNNIIELDLRLPNVPRTLNDLLGKLKTLQRLTISGDGQLPNGAIPPSIFQLENLIEFTLTSTGLTGPIPNTFDKMTSLKSLQFRSNKQLNVPIPDTISSTSLTTLVYNSQNTSGIIPDFIGNSESLRSSLETLDLSLNKLTGKIPDTLMNLTKLKSLNLGGNLLSGEIPPSFTSSKFTKSLISLDLNSNGFSGTIPASLNQFENLVDLNLQRNSFTGPIPSELSSLGKLSILSLNNNKLSGNIPDSIGTMNLDRLLVNDNALAGVIPVKICQRNYQACNLARNQLTSSTITCGNCTL
jgi:hypothetical protein